MALTLTAADRNPDGRKIRGGKCDFVVAPRLGSPLRAVWRRVRSNDQREVATEPQVGADTSGQNGRREAAPIPRTMIVSATAQYLPLLTPDLLFHTEGAHSCPAQTELGPFSMLL